MDLDEIINDIRGLEVLYAEAKYRYERYKNFFSTLCNRRDKKLAKEYKDGVKKDLSKARGRLITRGRQLAKEYKTNAKEKGINSPLDSESISL